MDIKKVEPEDDIYSCHQCGDVFDDEYEGGWWCYWGGCLDRTGVEKNNENK